MSSTVNDLFNSAEEEGVISNEAANVLSVVDIGSEIQAALGIPVDEVESSEAVLVTMMPDDSSSIHYGGNTRVVREGHNLVLDALEASRQIDNILVHNRYLNGEILYPYSLLTQAIRMDNSNYNPELGTPLYDQTVLLLGTVLAKAQDFSDNGVPVRSVTLIITDGVDQHSSKADAKMVKAIVDDMLRSEQHIVAAMGIDDGYTNFVEIFKEMGIRNEWILTPGNSASEIRKAFQVFSQSAIRASQGAVNFSKEAIGGFGN